jgi:polysaccharide export outer membrane protein
MKIKKFTLLILFFAIVASCSANAKTIYIYKDTKDEATNSKNLGYVLTKDTQNNYDQKTKGQEDSNDVETTKSDENHYKLSISDKLKITIFQEENLSGEYEIDSQGNINMPLIGIIQAKEKTVKQLEQDIKTKYESGYLVNPRVNIEITNVKPFFVIGEVNKPGSYPYKSGMNVLNAVATAGGYTYRANKNKIYIERVINNYKDKIRSDEEDGILPGDVIVIKERFF